MDVKQQPNDAADAARLYGQLEEKASDKIAKIISRQIDPIKAELVECHFERSPYHMKDMAMIVFSLNGETFKVMAEKQDFESKKIYEAVAESITHTLMNKLIMGQSKIMYER